MEHPNMNPHDDRAEWVKAFIWLAIILFLCIVFAGCRGASTIPTMHNAPASSTAPVAQATL